MVKEKSDEVERLAKAVKHCRDCDLVKKFGMSDAELRRLSAADATRNK